MAFTERFLSIRCAPALLLSDKSMSLFCFSLPLPAPTHIPCFSAHAEVCHVRCRSTVHSYGTPAPTGGELAIVDDIQKIPNVATSERRKQRPPLRNITSTPDGWYRRFPPVMPLKTQRVSIFIRAVSNNRFPYGIPERSQTEIVGTIRMRSRALPVSRIL